MKTIIALASSPNKGGNSDTLLDEFIAGIKESHQKLTVEKLYVCDIPSHFFDHGHKAVDQQEEPEFFELCEKVRQADGLVIATPTFNFNVPSKLKNFIDRIGYFALDYQKINRLGQPTGQLTKLRTFTIVTGGTPNLHRYFLFFLFPGFWLRAIMAYYGCLKYQTRYAGGLTFRNPAKAKPALLAQFKRLGRNFAEKI